MSNEVSLIIGTDRYIGWTNVSIKRSIESFANDFSITLLDAWENLIEFGIKPQLPCKVKIGSDLLITGYTDTLHPTVSKDDMSMNLTGRCKCGDLIDCSAMNTPGSWARPTSVRTICEELVTPFGIKVDFNTTHNIPKVEDFSIDTGQTVFDALKKLCEMRGLLCISNTEGNLVITNVGEIRSHDALAYGYNLLSAEADFNYTNRFSTYTIKGNASSAGDGWGASNINIKATATDSSVQRYRPKLIAESGYLTRQLAQQRANWEAHVRSAQSARIVVTLEGWRQSNGALWRENLLTIVDIPPLKIDQAEMVISQVTYNYSNNGEICELLLRRKDAFLANPAAFVQRVKPRKSGWE